MLKVWKQRKDWGCHKIKITLTHHHFDKIQSIKFKRTNTLLTTVAASDIRLYLVVENITINIVHGNFRPYIQTLTKFLITLKISKFYVYGFGCKFCDSIFEYNLLLYLWFLSIAELCS